MVHVDYSPLDQEPAGRDSLWAAPAELSLQHSGSQSLIQRTVTAEAEKRLELPESWRLTASCHMIQMTVNGGFDGHMVSATTEVLL